MKQKKDNNGIVDLQVLEEFRLQKERRRDTLAVKESLSIADEFVKQWEERYGIKP